MIPLRCTMLLFVAFLCGCSLLRNDDPPTIASLGQRPPRLQDTPIEVSEARAIGAYQGFLDAGSDSAARPQAMRRLADLKLEAEELPRAAVANAAQAEEFNPKQIADSIHLYEDILAQYPDRPDNDLVLYQLARAYERNVQPQRSLDALEQLIARYPRSDYLQEAQFRRGELLFVRKDYREAGQSYRAVVANGRSSPFYQQSLYKLGWCEFKQSRYDAGLDAFVALLDIQLENTSPGERRFSGLGRAERELLEDTLRVVSLSFSYQDGPRSVADYFARRGSRPYEDVVYDSLGQWYLQKERYTDAALTYRTFVERNPDHRQAPVFQMRVIQTYEKGGFPTLVLQSKQQFVDRYNLKAAYWQHHRPQESEEVVAYLRTTMIDLAHYYHAQAQDSRKPDDYTQAARWYRSFLASFPDTAEAPQLNFQLAELLFESGQLQLATREYVRTAYDYGTHDKAAEAGYAAVLAYTRVETQLDEPQRPAWRREAVENALRFATSFPAHPQATAVLTRAGEQLLASGARERAAQVARRVIEAHATPEQRRVAWTVLAQASFDLGDYLQAEHAYQEVLRLTPPQSDAYGNIGARLAASIYKQGEAARARGETAQAVEHFLRVPAVTPDAEIAPTAVYDAAAGLLSLRDWKRAAMVLEQFRSRYPHDPRQAEVTRRLAAAYQAAAQPLPAAEEFERIGHSEGDPELRREALVQAAELYGEAQRPEQALAVNRYYVEHFPEPPEAAIEARRRIAEHYRDSGDAAEYRRWLEDIIAADREAGTGRSERTRYLAAQATFTLAEITFERYQAVRLDLPLAESLAHKKRLMEEALRQYAQAAEYQIAEFTTAATCRSAAIYYHLSRALLESVRPPGLSGDALAQYSVLLEEQAYPFEEKAIELHEANLARIPTGVYDVWVAMSLEQLAELVPARYAKSERSAAYVEAIQ
jgi:tetratricopeptide (TPR) repeat protein